MTDVMIITVMFYGFLGAIALIIANCVWIGYKYIRYRLKYALLKRKYANRHVERIEGDEYWTITGPLINMDITSYIDSGSSFDDRNYESGNYFKDYDDAKYLSMEMKRYLKQR